MTFSPYEKQVLDLTERELLVLKLLERIGSVSMSELANILRLPRTSLYWPLSELKRRGLVGYELKGKRKQWFSRMHAQPFQKKLGSLESIAGDVRVIEGINEVKKFYQTILDLPAGERVLILEGNKAVRTITQKAGVEFMRAWHMRAHKQRIIFESILGEQIYQDLTDRLLRPEVIKSLAQWELWIGYIVPDEWIEGDTALLLFKNTAVLVDWESERALVVTTPEMVAQFRRFCEAFKVAGRKVNIVSDVRTVARKL